MKSRPSRPVRADAEDAVRHINAYSQHVYAVEAMLMLLTDAYDRGYDDALEHTLPYSGGRVKLHRRKRGEPDE